MITAQENELLSQLKKRYNFEITNTILSFFPDCTSEVTSLLDTSLINREMKKERDGDGEQERSKLAQAIKA